MVVLGVLATVSPTTGAVGQTDSASKSHARALLLPTPRCCMGMAYDDARGNVVVFGGQNRVKGWEFRDTWTWDGTAWTRQSPVQSPPQRFWAGMTYHADSARVVLTLGEDSNDNYLDTWTWNGADWQREPVGRMPSRRNAPGMTYDSIRQEAVLFGGYLLPGHTVVFHDTWTWDGSDWTKRTPGIRPEGRYGHSMAFDAARGVTVLFGGIRQENKIFGDTWTWDGSAWTKPSPSSSPPARSFASMAYDSARGETVLFGGIAADGEILDDTWVWDGTSWTRRHPDLSPAPRSSSGMAFDVANGETVLFGGTAPDGALYGDTWTWDGSAWSLRQG